MNVREVLRTMLIGGALLAMFAAIGVAIVSYTWNQTRPRIQENERNVLVRTLNDVLPVEHYNNDLIGDAVVVEDRELLGTPSPVTVYRAYRDDQPVAALFTSVAPDGYSGEIHLLIGVMADGTISGVRVLAHRETPGLGDFIEIERSDWIRHFSGKSLDNPPPQRWRVKRDGGAFDQVTGATITPRAVVRAVRNTLIYFEQHRDDLFERQ